MHRSPSKEKRKPTARHAREREVFYQYLAQQGLKKTNQRDVVLDLFLSSDSHMTAEDIYQMLKRKHSDIGYSTVYRTLKLLKECELAREVYFADGRMYFEHQFEQPHHDHMVCTQCGHTIEFFNATIEALQDKLAQENEFTPTRHTMVIFGYCRKCRDRRKL